MADLWRPGDFRRRAGESTADRDARLIGQDPSVLKPARQDSPAPQQAIRDAVERENQQSLAAEQCRAALAAAAPDSEALRRCKAAIRGLRDEDKVRLAQWFGDGMRG
jgi:hypothetical protein